jgi:hypothetical protein
MPHVQYVAAAEVSMPAEHLLLHLSLPAAAAAAIVVLQGAGKWLGRKVVTTVEVCVLSKHQACSSYANVAPAALPLVELTCDEVGILLHDISASTVQENFVQVSYATARSCCQIIAGVQNPVGLPQSLDNAVLPAAAAPAAAGTLCARFCAAQLLLPCCCCCCCCSVAAATCCPLLLLPPAAAAATCCCCCCHLLLLLPPAAPAGLWGLLPC